MTLSNQKAVYGLVASGVPTRTNVTGSSQIGIPQTDITFADADIFYSVKITATGTSDIATIDLEDGTVAQTSGTPTILDGNGKDFEGKTLPSAVNLYGFLIKAADGNAGNTSLGFNVIGPGDVLLNTFKAGVSTTGSSLAIQIATSGDSAEVTVIAKSS